MLLSFASAFETDLLLEPYKKDAAQTMWTRRCALLPLGGRTDEEALNVWEHVACARWLEMSSVPSDEGPEAARQRAFDEECDYWDGLVFWGQDEEARRWDEAALDADYSDWYFSDASDEDF